MTRCSMDINMSNDMDFCLSQEICLKNTENNYWAVLQKQH